MNPTEEQQKIINKIQEPECKLIKIDAVAGSGKTTLLQAITAKLKPSRGLYLAYNKAIATEASRKFGPTVECMTTHSLAYQNTIKPFKLTIGFFSYKDIRERLRFETKILVMDILNTFCLSGYDNFDKFREDEMSKNENKTFEMFEITKKYFNKMAQGEIPITHAGYLKLYHMLLAHKKISHAPFDLVMLDECGDINEVTLEIFKLLPANKKLMVGDNNQNIYTFNGTINGFDRMRDVGTEMHMTQSFRCSERIAERIEEFCRKYVDPNMSFIGTSTPKTPDGTLAVISRNNSSIIGEMIILNSRHIKYNLTRPAKKIFELILILVALKPNGIIYSAEWRYLQDDVNEWSGDMFLRDQYKTPLAYIRNLYGQDNGIKSALGILDRFPLPEIFNAYEQAKLHEKEKGHNVTLSTAHSMKGLEYSTVRITDDLNEAVQKIIDASGSSYEDYNEKEIETMRLYYVACSRAINKIENAIHLTDEFDI